MTTKQQRLKDVYAYVREHYGIHTQIDFAKALHITRPALSSAMNGNESYLTKNLFQKVCAAFPGAFNLDYLLTGEGSLLAPTANQGSTTHEMPHDQQAFDYTFLIEKAVDKATAYADKTIASLEKQLSDKNQYIERLENDADMKNRTIDLLQSRIRELESYISKCQRNDIDNYPFPVGVADDHSEQPPVNL